MSKKERKLLWILRIVSIIIVQAELDKFAIWIVDLIFISIDSMKDLYFFCSQSWLFPPKFLWLYYYKMFLGTQYY